MTKACACPERLTSNRAPGDWMNGLPDPVIARPFLLFLLIMAMILEAHRLI